MISVITPIFNILTDGRLEYFNKMMYSVHDQKEVELEHIVIDGGSEDGTVQLLRNYAESGWINNLVSEKDKGIYYAMNKGILLSHGEYINIMNSDDFFLDLNYFKRCIDALKEGDVDFTHADRIIKSRDGKADYVKKGDELSAFFRMPFRHQTMIVKREILDEIGLFDENYKIAADYKLVLQMLLAGKRGHYFPETVLCSLDGGASSDRNLCIHEVSRVLYEIYGHKNGLSIEDCVAIYTHKITPKLHSKIIVNIHDERILNSLNLCYQNSIKIGQ